MFPHLKVKQNLVHSSYEYKSWLHVTQWIIPCECLCSGIPNKAHSDGLPSYINAAQPVLERLKMAEYFSDKTYMSLYSQNRILFSTMPFVTSSLLMLVNWGNTFFSHFQFFTQMKLQFLSLTLSHNEWSWSCQVWTQRRLWHVWSDPPPMHCPFKIFIPKFSYQVSKV